MPIVVGVGRSGTTLLRLMLDAHPALAIPPETGFLDRLRPLLAAGPLSAAAFVQCLAEAHNWRDFHLDAEALLRRCRRRRRFSVTLGLREFYRSYAERFGKPRWGDKTPVYGQHLAAVEELLPEAHFVHLIRDGRDVALSLRQVWFAPGQDAATLARHWRDWVAATRRAGAERRRYLEVRFEELVAAPRRVLEGICSFIDLPYHPAMERYHLGAAARLAEVTDVQPAPGVVVTREARLRQHPFLTSPPLPTRVGLWRRDMSAADRAVFETHAGPLLRELGYEVETPVATTSCGAEMHTNYAL